MPAYEIFSKDGKAHAEETKRAESSTMILKEGLPQYGEPCASTQRVAELEQKLSRLENRIAVLEKLAAATGEFAPMVNAPSIPKSIIHARLESDDSTKG